MRERTDHKSQPVRHSSPRLRDDIGSPFTFHPSTPNACLHRARRDAQGGPLIFHFSPIPFLSLLTNHFSPLTAALAAFVSPSGFKMSHGQRFEGEPENALFDTDR
jgi:hypothetical protein